MPTLTLLVGLPASGKTTFCEKSFNEEGSPVRISLDDFRKLICGKDYFKPFEPTVHAWAQQTTRYLLSQGHDVVLDATSLTQGLRNIWVSLAREYLGVYTSCIYFDVPFEVCLKRNAERERKVPEDVIKRMSEQLQPPDLDFEDFDSVWFVTPNGLSEKIK